MLLLERGVDDSSSSITVCEDSLSERSASSCWSWCGVREVEVVGEERLCLRSEQEVLGDTVMR